MIHSVADSTALSGYLPALKKLLVWARDKPGRECCSWDELDSALVTYLTQLCYEKDKHPHQGNLVMNGLGYLWPEATRMLPRAWRASQAFAKVSITGQGSPIALDKLACMEEWLRQRKEGSAQVVADMIPVGVDGYLRGGDMREMRKEDLVWNEDTVAVRLGRSERGESSKSGRNQGVVFEDPYAVAVLRRRVEKLATGERVFPVSSATLRRWWDSAARALGLEVGSLHRLEQPQELAVPPLDVPRPRPRDQVVVLLLHVAVDHRAAVEAAAAAPAVSASPPRPNPARPRYRVVPLKLCLFVIVCLHLARSRLG